ncbi:MAG: RHS repeat-associated core domain-containing protein [Bacteroidota bacterium]
MEFFGQSVQSRKDFLNTWAFLYQYDGRHRMTMKKVPGADSVFMVYDQWDRLVLTQDGVQRNSNSWLFTKYDKQNRPIITGMMKTTLSVDSARSFVAAQTNRFETFNTGGINQYTDVTYPSNALVDQYLTVTYYDNYTFDDHVSWDTLGLGFNDPETILTQNLAIKGQVTGTMTKVGDGSWIRSISYYDDKYRMIQSASTNHLGGVDRVTNYYDFIGQVNRTIGSHSEGSNTITISRSFVYDHTGRLLETWHKLNQEDSVLIAKNDYNEMGELLEKDLHHGAQSLDYAYNIRGWLTRVNYSDLSTSLDDDLFGFNLSYDQVDGDLGNDSLFNGNISGMKWSTHNDQRAENIKERGYVFDYDGLNRLKEAQSRRENAGWGSTSQFKTHYTYDLNGNIESLDRSHLTYQTIDDLTYQYNGNQLMAVADNGAIDSLGFVDGNTVGDDYDYDANGNMVKDLNKEIDSIYYNHLNLPIKVEFIASGDSITYLYDAAGIKLQQAIYDSGALVKTTDYLGEFIYESDTSGTRKLQFIQHEEGRIVYMDFEQKWDYQYHLKDHLGNVRMTFSTEPNVYDRIASMEDAGETDAFDHWVQIQRNGPSNAGNTSSHVMRLNTDSQGDSTLIEGVIGLSTMYAVQKGDQLDLSAKAYYEQAPQQNGFFASNLLLNMIINGSTGSSTTGTENGVAIQNSNLDETMVGSIQQNKTDDLNADAPRAYMNWLIFDKDTVLITSGFRQISTLAQFNWETITTTEPIKIEEDGFFFTYVSNETNGLSVVDFDDFHIALTKTNVVSVQDYYPFGLTFNESVRVGSREQNYLYNMKELQEKTGWLDYGARMYQPELGRFFRPDRFGEKYYSMSPYGYAAGNPIKFIDINGDSLWIQTQYNLVRYENGRIYNKKGKDVTKKAYNKKGELKKNDFGRVLGGLNNITSKSVFGSKMVNSLQLSDNKFVIRVTDAESPISGNPIAYAPVEISEGRYAVQNNNAYAFQIFDQGSMIADYAPFDQIGSGGSAVWNPEAGWTNLAHELGHLYDADNGLLDNRRVKIDDGFVEIREIRAQFYENTIRIEAGMNPEENYSGGPRLLDANNKPLYIVTPFILKALN